VRDAAHISARPEYVDLLSHLVTTSEPPPLTTYQKYIRWLNKKLGHPPTVQVGILSSLITDLSAEIKSSYPSITLNNVVVTAPLVPALTQLDLNDAIEHASLQSWLTKWPSPPKLSESRAQFAAEGNGLCKTYQNQADCDEEEVDMVWETAYFVQ
jgi:hypothetical protein